MAAGHPGKNRQKKARKRKPTYLKKYNPPAIRDDLPERPPKPPRISKRESKRRIMAAVQHATGLDRIYAAMDGMGCYG